MAMGTDDNHIYLVPVIDVNWLVYAPFDPGRDFRVDPPNVPQSVIDTRKLVAEMRNLTDGKFILTPHAGTYCRTGYYEGEMLDVYREACAIGGEVAVHLHEEIKGHGTRYDDEAHMRTVFKDAYDRLVGAGLDPVAYRAGHYAYHPLTSGLLEEFGIHVDYSCAPGMNAPEREAVWTHAETSAAYLPENPRAPWEGQKLSPVLEIPIGSDGQGAAYANILHIEQSEMDNLTRIWDVILDRARRQGRPQIVHCLFHTASVERPEWLERYRRFLDMVPRSKGQFISTDEARNLHGLIAREAAA